MRRRDIMQLENKYKLKENVYDIRLKTDELIVVRIDGVRFAKQYAKDYIKNYDKTFFDVMCNSTKLLCENNESTLVGYTFSDEINIVLKGDQINSNNHNRVQKIVSLYSSKATLSFINSIKDVSFDELKKNCIFAAKTYNIQKDELNEYLKWRQLWSKQAVFDKKLHKENIDWRSLGGLVLKENTEWIIKTNVNFTTDKLNQNCQGEEFSLSSVNTKIKK